MSNNCNDSYNINSLTALLEEGIKRNRLIPTKGVPRGCGKTKALIELGQKMDIPVIVPIGAIARAFRMMYGYMGVYSVKDVGSLPEKAKVLVDEGVFIPGSILGRRKIIGGWYSEEV